MNDKQIDYMDEPIQEPVKEEKISKLLSALVATGFVVGIPLIIVGIFYMMKFIVENHYIGHFGIACSVLLASIIWYSIYKDLSR